MSFSLEKRPIGDRMTPMIANELGEQLFILVSGAYTEDAIAVCKEADLYSPRTNASIITDMILEAHSEAELREILQYSERIVDLMIDCIKVILATSLKRTER